jgi:hypothetical protein
MGNYHRNGRETSMFIDKLNSNCALSHDKLTTACTSVKIVGNSRTNNVAGRRYVNEKPPANTCSAIHIQIHLVTRAAATNIHVVSVPIIPQNSFILPNFNGSFYSPISQAPIRHGYREKNVG